VEKRGIGGRGGGGTGKVVERGAHAKKALPVGTARERVTEKGGYKRRRGPRKDAAARWSRGTEKAGKEA